MIRKIVLVAVVALCLVAALLVGASLKASSPEAKYLGYWRAADEIQTGGPLLIRVVDTNGEITIPGLPNTNGYYEFKESTPTKLTVETGTSVVGAFLAITFDTDVTGATMRVTAVPVEDPGTQGVPQWSYDVNRATGPEDQLAAELAAQVARQNRPPETVIQENAHILSQAIERWAAAHKGHYPPLEQVLVGAGIDHYIEGGWPTNPVSGAPMSYSSEIGDYTYTTTGASYRLSVTLPDGSTLTLP